MSDDDEQDPKPLRPTEARKKETTPAEAAEDIPWSHLRTDPDRDRHHHV